MLFGHTISVISENLKDNQMRLSYIKRNPGWVKGEDEEQELACKIAEMQGLSSC